MSELPSQVGLHAFVVNAREHDKAVKITPRFGVVGVTGFYAARHSPWGPWLTVVGGGPGVSAMSWSAPIPDPGRGGVPFPPFPGVAVRRAAPRWSGGGPAIRGNSVAEPRRARRASHMVGASPAEDGPTRRPSSATAPRGRGRPVAKRDPLHPRPPFRHAPQRHVQRA